jgi:hypothetical protein
VNLITCKSDTNKNECIESNILINELYANTLAYLDSINVTFPSLSNFAALRVVMFVPQENVTDDFKFYTAMGMNSSLNGFGSYDKLGNFKATYVELTEEQLLAILPFTTNVGISTEPLLSLMIGESLTYTTEYMFKGNTLILPNYMDEVLALIKDNPRFTMTDPYSLVQKIQ